MRYERFGSSGLNVLRVGFGCNGMSGANGAADETESIATIRRAIDPGSICSIPRRATPGPQSPPDRPRRSGRGDRLIAEAAARYSPETVWVGGRRRGA